MSITIRNVATPDRVTIPAGAPVSEAAQKMRDLGIGTVVVTEGGKACGVMTDRDIVVWVVAEGKSAQTKIREVLESRQSRSSFGAAVVRATGTHG